MEYLEIIVTAAEESKDAVTYLMREMGALGFIERNSAIIAYFGPGQSPAEICSEIARFEATLKSSGLDSSLSCAFTVLPDCDWNETWKKSFTPIDVGRTLRIMPSWLNAETDRIPIIIDPGMVFGTGHHETTRTCLSLIEKTALTGSRKRFLDVGTGTGILAIGAGRLGYAQVVAVDTDPLAVDAATRNAAANGLENIEIRQGDICAASGTFNVIVANLLSEILIAIAPELALRLNPGGTAILSGLLVGQEDEVSRVMSAAGLTLREKINDGKWVSLILGKPRE
jgi:ribosomal protein L11 methyltransferase